MTEALKAIPAGLPICTVVELLPDTTWTPIEAVLALAAALTVIARNDGSPAVDSVASAEPVASVVACVTATPPEVALKVTGTPAIRLFDASRTSAVMVAVVDPSERMVGELVVRVTAATVGVTVVVPVAPVEPVVPVVVPVVVADSPVIDFDVPPQPASTTIPNQAMIDNLRILHPCSPLGGGPNQ